MKHIKTPVRYCDEDWMIFDADDQWLASFDAGEVGPEVVRALNTHDDAIDACQASYNLLAGWHPQYPDDMRKKAQVIKMLSNVLASAPKREE